MGNPRLEGDVRMEILVIAYVLTGVRKVVKGHCHVNSVASARPVL